MVPPIKETDQQFTVIFQKIQTVTVQIISWIIIKTKQTLTDSKLIKKIKHIIHTTWQNDISKMYREDLEEK